jgi:DNA polymerase delta subunit 1
MIVPVLRQKKTAGVGFVGADVLEPKTGFYDRHPIATLDFASLYPSIMIAHNLCYTTLIPQKDIDKYRPDEYTKTPTNPPSYFAKTHKREGLLAKVLLDLLNARKKARKLLAETKANLKNAKTEEEKAEYENLIGVYDGRQLALKVSANSVYGFTGAQVGALPCLEIAGSVTAFGRNMILLTKNSVLELFSK